jgi:hypothetical protein
MQKAAANAGGQIRSAFRRNPVYWLIASGAVLVTAIAVGTGVMVGNFRDRALENSKRELENTTLLLARHFDQQFEEATVVQQDIENYLRSSGIASEEDYRRTVSRKDIHMLLKSKVSAMTYVGALSLFDSEGTLLNTSAAWPAPPVSLADRSYFIALKENPAFRAGGEPADRSPDHQPVTSAGNGGWRIPRRRFSWC